MILHVDMDAFYASVEQRDRPELAGKAVIVGGPPEGRGVVAAANYLARESGVHSAMPAVEAKRRCPHAVFLRPRMERYAEVSAALHAVFDKYTPLVEPLSLDEAFLDVTGSEPLYGSAVAIGRRIKQEIRDHLMLVASVGVAPNKFLAKIASDLDKPDGFVVVEPDRVRQFLDPLPISRLWGVGQATGRRFERLGVRTIGQLRHLPVEQLRSQLGSSGERLWQLAHGIDSRPVIPQREAKSISHEKTFPRDLEELQVVGAWLQDLSGQVACRLRRHRLLGRTVHLKVRYDDFHTITRSRTLAEPTDVTAEIWQVVRKMLNERRPKRALRVRLLGVGISGLRLRGPVQLSLLDTPEHDRQKRLDEVADNIHKKYGVSSLQRGLGLVRDQDAEPHGSGDGIRGE